MTPVNIYYKGNTHTLQVHSKYKKNGGGQLNNKMFAKGVSVTKWQTIMCSVYRDDGAVLSKYW